jgi:6-phosphogluconolactonase
MTSSMFAYVGCRTTRERGASGEGLAVYRLDGPAASWSQVQLLRGLINPSFLAFGPGRRTLYTVHGDQSEVSAFRVDPHDGTLTALNRQSTEGRNPVHLAFDRTGRFLVVANYATGTLASLPVGADGSLEPICDLLTLPGEIGSHRTQQTAAHPHQVLPDPTGAYLIVPDKGLDRIFTIQCDGVTGKLRVAAQIASRPGAGPRHGVFHPGASIFYAANELDSSVTTHRYDPATGELTPQSVIPTLPTDFFGDSTVAAIDITPDGRFVYLSNRGHDSIVVCAVEPCSFTLRPVGWTNTRGTTPRFITLDPTGRSLFVANETSNDIVAFHIDPANGQLTPADLKVATGSPVCVLLNDMKVSG